MRSLRSVLGKRRKKKPGWIISPGLDDRDALWEYMRKKYGESVLKVILLFELDNDAKGFLVRTESRILFCAMQNVNRYKEAFVIKWVIDDLRGTTLDIRPVATNEIQVTPNRTVLFDPELISAHRLVEEIHEAYAMSRMTTTFPPKEIKTAESALAAYRQKTVTGKKGETSLEEVADVIRSVEFIPQHSERGYQVQLYQALAQNYSVKLEGAKKGARFDMIVGRDEIAVELKIVRNSSVFDRTVGQITRYKDEVRRIIVVLMNLTRNPSLIKDGVRRLEEIDPGNIRVIVVK